MNLAENEVNEKIRELIQQWAEETPLTRKLFQNAEYDAVGSKYVRPTRSGSVVKYWNADRHPLFELCSIEGIVNITREMFDGLIHRIGDEMPPFLTDADLERLNPKIVCLIPQFIEYCTGGCRGDYLRFYGIWDWD